MDVFLDIFLDALIDTAFVVPFILILHLFLELLEHSVSLQTKTAKLLNGKYSVLIATGAGIIPQCGFSVIAAKLYSNNNIKLGTLMAVFIVTSDEALPVLLVNPGGFTKLLPLLVIKIVFALAMGYGINFFLRNKQTKEITQNIECACGHDHNHEDEQNVYLQEEKAVVAKSITNSSVAILAVSSSADGAVLNNTNLNIEKASLQNVDNNQNSDTQKSNILAQDNTADIKTAKRKEVLNHVVHALKHTLEIALFIFIVNIVFGTILYFIGEEQLSLFLEKNKFLQPIMAALIGLIPNCAGSVVIAQAYSIGIIHLGAATTGLCISAGIAFTVLFKENKNIKNNLFILGILVVSSVTLGMAITFFI